jgi:hypothetical protein
LIELAVVLVLLALLSSGVLVSARGALEGRRLGDILGRLEEADALARALAESEGSAGLELDTLRALVDVRSGEREEMRHQRVDLRPASITALRLEGSSGWQRGDRISVPFDFEGGSASYALRLEWEGRDLYVLFAGLSGQATTFETMDKVEEVFGAIARHDAR